VSTSKTGLTAAQPPAAAGRRPPEKHEHVPSRAIPALQLCTDGGRVCRLQIHPHNIVVPSRQAAETPEELAACAGLWQRDA